MKNKAQIERRIKLLYILAEYIGAPALKESVYRLGIMIDNENPIAESKLLFFETNIIAMFEDSEVKDIPLELLENLSRN